MKSMILGAIFVLTCLSSANAHVENDTEKTIRQNIDNICGDTWCESADFDYKFDNLQISGDKATLYFTQIERVIKKNKSGQDEEVPGDSKQAVCHFTIVPEKNMEDIEPDVMDQISECIEKPDFLQ